METSYHRFAGSEDKKRQVVSTLQEAKIKKTDYIRFAGSYYNN